MKPEKQFKALMQDCSTKGKNCFGVAIESDRSSVTGVSKKVLAPHSAIVLIQHNQQRYIKGFLDGVTYESSSIEGLDASKPILIGVDCRIKDNNIIFYKSGTTINKISANSELELTDIMYLYWEYESHASLTICSFDPNRDEVVREVASSNTEPMNRFLRTIFKQALQTNEVIIENRNDESELEQYFTEDNHDEFNWN